MMSRRMSIAALGGLAAACSPLGALGGVNRLAPGDRGAKRVAQGLAFGSHPRQRLDVYAPAAPGPHPVLLWLYGGSWRSGRREDYAFAGEAFAGRGFVTLVADYRLVPEAVFPAFVEDGAAAAAWAVANAARFGGDPKRLGVAGHSAGAYNALMLALDPRFVAAAGAPGAVRACAALAPPVDFLPLDSAATIDAFGRYPDLPATQPLRYARAGAPPLWLGTGDSDTTVRPRNSERMAGAVRAAGGKAELRVYPGQGHIGVLLALSRAFRGRAPVLDDMAGFLRANL